MSKEILQDHEVDAMGRKFTMENVGAILGITFESYRHCPDYYDEKIEHLKAGGALNIVDGKERRIGGPHGLH